MFFARDKSLFDLLLPHYGVAAMNEVCGAFELMELPMPDKAEYRDTTDVGALTLLNPYGCTIRVTDRKKLLCETALRHPRFLQPLGTFAGTKLKIDIYPGIDVLPQGSAGPDKELFKDFRRCGLEPFDAKRVNCGTLRNGYTVMFDIPGVEKLDDRIEDHEIIVPEDDTQTGLYQHLRDTFSSAITTRNFQPFWDLCIAEHQCGLLKSSWMTTMTDSMVDVPATAYERRLIQHKGITQYTVSNHFGGYNLGAML